MRGSETRTKNLTDRTHVCAASLLSGTAAAFSRYILLASALVCSAGHVFVYADSSWVWVSRVRPFDILPFVAVITILTEWIWIQRSTRIRNHVRALAAVFLANLASFLIPFLFLAFVLSWYGSLNTILDSGPHHIVGAFFLALTLMIEIPAVYTILKNDVAEPKKLLRAIVISNIVTTLFVAVIERLITQGHW